MEPENVLLGNILLLMKMMIGDTREEALKIIWM